MADSLEMYGAKTKDGKKLSGDEAKRYLRQEKAKETLSALEKENTTGRKITDAITDIGMGARKLSPFATSEEKAMDFGAKTKERNRRLDEAKKEIEMKSGGKVSSASKRADGCAIRGKTRA